MKFFAVVLPLFAACAVATPTQEKRQFMIPPDSCTDEQKWFDCASRNPGACLGHPASQLLCKEACEPCCKGEEGLGCV